MSSPRQKFVAWLIKGARQSKCRGDVSAAGGLPRRLYVLHVPLLRVERGVFFYRPCRYSIAIQVVSGPNGGEWHPRTGQRRRAVGVDGARQFFRSDFETDVTLSSNELDGATGRVCGNNNSAVP